MNYNNLFLSLLLLLGVCSCDLDVIPDMTGDREVSFTADLLMPLDGGGCDIPCTVNINNTSSFSIASFAWDLGDGSTSNERDPAPHTYTEYDSYIISLSAFAADGTLIGTQTATINVVDTVQNPVPLFIVENEGCFAPCVLTFDNISSNSQSYVWDFGDGTDTVSTMSTAPLEHTYAKSGTYTVMLTAKNGNKTAITTQTVDVNIWTPPTATFNAGSGKAIFQIEDHAYLIVGNIGLSGGLPFIKRVFADENGNATSDPTIIIDIGFDMEVSDAALLSDGTIAIIGFASPEAGGSLRSLYLRVSPNGNVETPAEFLPEIDLDDWNIRPKNLIELPSPDNRLLITGNARRGNPTENEVFYRVFSRTLDQVNITQIITAGIDEKTHAGQISGSANNWAIGFSRENADGSFQAELMITDNNGNSLVGFPRVLGTGLVSTNVLSMNNNEIFMAGLTPTNELYIAKTGLTSSSNINTNLLDINASPRDLTYSPTINRLLLSTQQADKGVFFTFNNDLQIDRNSEAFGNSSSNGFNTMLSSRDCGFAACGFSGDVQTLFFVKTNENGRIP